MEPAMTMACALARTEISSAPSSELNWLARRPELPPRRRLRRRPPQQGRTWRQQGEHAVAEKLLAQHWSLE
jgi:hypothetical protein